MIVKYKYAHTRENHFAAMANSGFQQLLRTAVTMIKACPSVRWNFPVHEQDSIHIIEILNSK